ncbi:MAG: TerC family protein, partial [Burkholderiales bacterium]|nr:TerC family protein [Burkholderiales bacterium]
GIDGGTTLFAAIKTIIVADAVMSLDNVIAVAGASHGSIVLVAFGIFISIPIVVWGSKLVLTLMDKFPIVITLGAALLGWIAGGMMLADPTVPDSVSKTVPYSNYVFGTLGALLVVVVGKFMASRREAAPAHDVTSQKSVE